MNIRIDSTFETKAAARGYLNAVNDQHEANQLAGKQQFAAAIKQENASAIQRDIAGLLCGTFDGPQDLALWARGYVHNTWNGKLEARKLGLLYAAAKHKCSRAKALETWAEITDEKKDVMRQAISEGVAVYLQEWRQR